MPPSAVVVGGGVCLSTCWDSPPRCGPGAPLWVWAWRPGQIPFNSPLGVDLETPLPSQIPLNFPSECGPGNLQGMLGYHSPPRPAARHTGIPPPPHPVNRMTDRCKNIILPQTSFAGGKNRNKNLCHRKYHQNQHAQKGKPACQLLPSRVTVFAVKHRAPYFEYCLTQLFIPAVAVN